MNVIATELLRYFPEALFGRVHETVPIMTGLSGASVYSAKTDTGEFILRIGIADCNAFARSLAAERTAARHGLAPAIVHIDEGTSAIVSVKIASIPFGSALAQPSLRPVVITKLVNCLAQLHSISAPYLPATPNIATLGQSIWDRQAIKVWFSEMGDTVPKRYCRWRRCLRARRTARIQSQRRNTG